MLQVRTTHIHWAVQREAWKSFICSTGAGVKVGPDLLRNIPWYVCKCVWNHDDAVVTKPTHATKVRIRPGVRGESRTFTRTNEVRPSMVTLGPNPRVVPRSTLLELEAWQAHVELWAHGSYARHALTIAAVHTRTHAHTHTHTHTHTRIMYTETSVSNKDQNVSICLHTVYDSFVSHRHVLRVCACMYRS